MSRTGQHSLKHRNKIQANPALEKMVLFVAITEPLMTTPQILQIYGSHSAGVSIATWILYLGASAIWLFYGIKTRNKPIIITDTLWVIVEVAVVVGVITR